MYTYIHMYICLCHRYVIVDYTLFIATRRAQVRASSRPSAPDAALLRLRYPADIA